MQYAVPAKCQIHHLITSILGNENHVIRTHVDIVRDSIRKMVAEYQE